MTNKKCHKCECTLDYDQGKSVRLLISILIPIFVLIQIRDYLGVWSIVLSVTVFCIGIYAYLTNIPLVQKNET
jgi:predicted membrane channel-forming protein YqfA (hemolysin III family)